MYMPRMICLQWIVDLFYQFDILDHGYNWLLVRFMLYALRFFFEGGLS